MADTTIEIVSGRERRRRWSVEEKLRIVAATYEPGACVKQVAASYDLYPGLLFTWRRQAREGTLAPAPTRMFLPVRAAAATASMLLPEIADTSASRPSGQIEVELKDGSRVRFDSSVSLASLRRVIAALRG
jgi:transposase